MPYGFIGLSMPAVVDLPWPDVQLDFTAAHNGARVAGAYPGYDRFGRVSKQHWVDGNFTTHGSVGTIPNIPPILELDYVYDKASNRLAVVDGRPRARQANRDHVATMDGLHRLTRLDRGIAVEAMGSWSIGTFSTGSQGWEYDHLGNWLAKQEDATGDGDFLDADEREPRTHNLANELLGRDLDDDSTDDVVITHDHAGNILLVDDGTTEYGYVHDAWNRLVKITIDGGMGASTLGEYTYNGLRQRMTATVDTDFSGSVDERRIMIYDSAWRLVEEEIDTDLDDDADEARAHVWGIRYIDDAVAMFRDTDADGDYEDGGGSERYFFVTDAQFSVMAVIDDAANLKERIRYDAYGRARHHDWRDVDGDGDYDTDDLTIIETIIWNSMTALGMPISNATWYDPDADLNRDGWVSMADAGLGGITWSAALARGVLSSDAVGNTTGYNGYRYTAEIMSYIARNRWYDPVMGRWLQRDPAGYVDGMNLYEYAMARPLVGSDPLGFGVLIDERGRGSKIRNLKNGQWMSRQEYRNLFIREARPYKGGHTPSALGTVVSAGLREVVTTALHAWISNTILEAGQSMSNAQVMINACNTGEGMRASIDSKAVYGIIRRGLTVDVPDSVTGKIFAEFPGLSLAGRLAGFDWQVAIYPMTELFLRSIAGRRTTSHGTVKKSFQAEIDVTRARSLMCTDRS